jgi:hypothetical protein
VPGSVPGSPVSPKREARRRVPGSVDELCGTVFHCVTSAQTEGGALRGEREAVRNLAWNCRAAVGRAVA